MASGLIGEIMPLQAAQLTFFNSTNVITLMDLTVSASCKPMIPLLKWGKPLPT